jgi:pescadillo protein
MPKAKFAERGKVKPKSVKSRAVLSGSRLKTRFGKKLKKGTGGAAAEFIGRTRAVKKLQVTLRDFRRLCILKGIYPRDPKSKASLDPKQTYYHFKDIAFLAHEPLMRKFREQAVFMRRVKRLVGRRELDAARHALAAKPTFTLDHLVKERYPRFADALGDLDDALSLVALFASFPAEAPIKAAHTAVARRLSREWLYYVARAKALKKVFFSIKGCYFQAEVKGVPVTWLVPWAFSQVLPSDVDYNVMLTFLDLYEVRLGGARAAKRTAKRTAS